MTTKPANKTFKEVLIFEREKETRNTIRYREVSEVDPPAVGTIYIQKECLETPPPERLTVTVEVAKTNA